MGARKKPRQRFIKSTAKHPGALVAMAKREGGLNKDGSISKKWAEKKLANKRTTEPVKKRLRFFLNVLQKNPVPKGEYEKVQQAIELFKRFRNENPQFIDEITLSIPKVGMVIGQCEGVLYKTRRNGKIEHYIHKFTGKSQPLLCSAWNGYPIFFIGGEYDFTPDGIVDRKK